MYYNYVYLDPRKPGKYEYLEFVFDFEPIYYGKGSGKRLNEHLTFFKGKRFDRLNSILKNKLNKIYLSNLKPIVLIIKYFETELEAYDFEKLMISTIGTIDGETEKRGSLCNFCLDNRPPNHKGKTYEDIHGKEKAKLLIEKKRMQQIAVGGYFGGRKHTDEMKRKHSERYKGSGNPRYGVKISQEQKDKCKKTRTGKPNPIQQKWHYIYNDKIYIVDGHDKKQFCIEYNISLSALDKRVDTDIAPKYGKSKDWKLFRKLPSHLQEVERLSYTVGAFKQDVDDQDFSNFSL